MEGTGVGVGTKFRPGAFAGFTDVPMASLVGRSLPARDVFGAEIAACDDVVAQVATVERFLAERMPDADPGYDLVRAVVEDMLHSPPSDRVDAVARRHGVSARTLQRLFRRYIGLGPKWVLQRYRLHEATERMSAGERDLTRLALDLGYFDLAHCTRHFRRVVGRSPTAFLRA